MTIWGVTIDPDHPYTHRFDKAKGKLHISQVTIEEQNANLHRYFDLVKVKCNVWHTENPICLCSISPDAKHKSFPLNFEFGEDDGDVVISVYGHYDVHLAGYSLGGHGEGA